MVSTQKFPLADQRPLTEVNLPRQPATSEADFDVVDGARSRQRAPIG